MYLKMSEYDYECYYEARPINCEEICQQIYDGDAREYMYQFGLLIIMLFFFILARPVVLFCTNRYCCTRDAENRNTVTNDTASQEVQCDIDIGMHRLVIHPDNTMNLSELN